MKYLLINSVAGIGSTGRIAAEKCRELMKQGHSCVLAYGRQKANCDDIETWQIGKSLDYKIHGVMNRLLDNHGFGSKAATKAFLERVKAYDPDVIWLHNLHGYYINIELLFAYLKICGKKVIWTLHDCWSFTGHCAYFDFVGCDRWKTGCYQCPQKKGYPSSILLDNSRMNYIRKKELFTGIPDMTLIVPSHWLEERVHNSFLGDYQVEVVYNTVDPKIFRPVSSDFRKKFGLENAQIVLGVANVWEERKGLKDFVKLSQMLEDPYRIVLVGLSAEQLQNLPKNILGLPRTNSVQELVQIYSAADVYVNPSVEETFGMTSMEALCCGTRAIVYKGTACEEIAKEFGGTVVDRGPEHILQAILTHAT